MRIVIKKMNFNSFATNTNNNHLWHKLITENIFMINLCCKIFYWFIFTQHNFWFVIIFVRANMQISARENANFDLIKNLTFLAFVYPHSLYIQ